VPRRPRDLLGLEQRALDRAAVVHLEERGRRDPSDGQYQAHVRSHRAAPGPQAQDRIQGMTTGSALFSPEDLAAGERLVARPWRFVKGVVALDGLPDEGWIEVAFAGRSNVGKSSLINAMVRHGG